MTTPFFPTDCWYAVATSSQVTHQPFPIRLLEQEILLRRIGATELSAHSAICRHRRCHLKGAAIDADYHLTCPFHGWTYDAMGHCVEIPLLRSGEVSPSDSNLRSFPVQEKNGLIWLWFSPDGQAPTYEVPVIAELEGLTLLPSTDIEYHFAANYTRTLENILDPTHAPFTHGSSVGKVDPQTDYTMEHYEVNHDPLGFTAQMPIKVKKIKGLTSLILDKNSNPYKEYRYIYPNIGISTIHFGKLTLCAIQAHIPESEQSTTVRLTNARNFLLKAPLITSWFDRVTIQTGTKICMEDEAIILDQVPVRSEFVGSNEVLVGSDSIIIAFRKYLKEKQIRAAS